MTRLRSAFAAIVAAQLLALSHSAQAQVAAATPEQRATASEVVPSPPAFDFVLEALVETGQFTSSGTYEGRQRGFLHILGGTFKGPLMQGKILPTNRDWPEYYPNGARTTSVDYVYRTDDGSDIFVSVDGWRYATRLSGPLAEYEAANPGGNLLRAFVRMRAPDTSRYAWVNYELFYAVAGTAVKTPEGPRSRIRIYRLK